MTQLQSSDKIMSLYYAVNVQCLYSCPTSKIIVSLLNCGNTTCVPHGYGDTFKSTGNSYLV